MPVQKDPASELLEGPAAEFLQRVYAAPRGRWVPTRLGDPGPMTRLSLSSLGIDWRGPDNASTPSRRGGLNCKDRWTRAFVRAAYRMHERHSTAAGLVAERRTTRNRADALEFDIGNRLRVIGVIPAGRAIRARIRPGGRAANQAARKMPDSGRIFTDDGDQGGRASRVELRDW